jgi:hypothetical protein
MQRPGFSLFRKEKRTSKILVDFYLKNIKSYKIKNLAIKWCFYANNSSTR